MRTGKIFLLIATCIFLFFWPFIGLFYSQTFHWVLTCYTDVQFNLVLIFFSIYWLQKKRIIEKTNVLHYSVPVSPTVLQAKEEMRRRNTQVTQLEYAKRDMLGIEYALVIFSGVVAVFSIMKWWIE